MCIFPLVSIIILNYNGLKYMDVGLKECLDSVIKTKYPNYEIIFIDNGSTDGSVDFVLKRYPQIIVHANEHNFGFSEGFNSGMRLSKGKYLALLSNDMCVDPNWLNPVIELMESDREIGFVGFKRMLYGHSNIIDGIGGNLYLSGRIKQVGKHERDNGQWDHIVDDLDYIGGAMTLRKEILKTTGLFDSDYFIFSEDIDLCFRIRKKGYKIIYMPNAIIYHRGQVTLKGRDPKGDYLEYMSNRSRIRCGIIHFIYGRLLSMFLIDSISIILVNTNSKLSLIKAYLWNIKNIRVTLNRRWGYGPSPPYKPKYPVLFLSISDVIIRLKEILSLRNAWS